MEEEIITPEEEVFNYSKLRYILDKDGYVCHASLGGLIVCDLGECTEYTGEVPEGYETIEEWYDKEIDKLNAWKIVEGNLIYDEYKYNELQIKFEKEAEENAAATKKYVDSKLLGISVSGTKNVKELFDPNSANDFKVIQLTDTSDFEINKLVIKAHTSNNIVNIIFNTLNILPNELLSTNKNELSFNVSADKSIEISGTSTSDFEIDLYGNDANRNSQLVIKKDVEYFLSGLDGIKLNMYYFDGTNRTQIYSGTGGSILFTDEDKLVTQITLEFTNGSKIDKTINPMLNLGNSALPYEKYDVYKLNIDIPAYEFLPFSEDLFLSEDLYSTHWGEIQLIIENNVIKLIDDDENELGKTTMPATFYPSTTIYTLQDTTMSLNYVTSYSNGVPYTEVIKAINDSPETITINADRININGVITAINNDTSTTIDGNKITTGTITAEQVAADIITTKNFSAQTINADNITAGTLRGRAIEGGTITGSTISGGSISIAKGNYFFNMGTSTSNPNCSGLNVGAYGVKAYSNITATGFAITDSDTGKSGTFILKHSNGSNVVYLTFTGGILTAFDIV